MVQGRKNSEDRREWIAEAAWRVIAREGLRGANLREIAREAGHTTGVLSHYFRDKQELLSFAYGLVMDRSAARFNRVAREEGLAEALAEMLPLDDYRHLECLVWLSLTTAAVEDPSLTALIQTWYERARSTMRDAFIVMFPDIENNENLLEDVSDQLLMTVDGIAMNALTDPDRYPPERQWALLVRSLHGLRLEIESGQLVDNEG